MSTIGRTLKNFMKIGPKQYMKQLDTIGDTKWGRLVGIDANGNRFFENNDEVSGRERWVEYASNQPDPEDIAPEWYMWLSRIAQEPPTEWKMEPKKWWGEPTPNFSGTKKGFKTYSTTVPKLYSWEPTQYLQVVRAWPKDELRPNRGMKEILAKRVEEGFKGPNANELDIKKAQRELKALQSILDNKFKNDYPLPQQLFRPVDNPQYYERLISSLEAQKKGSTSVFNFAMKTLFKK
ncbi:NADH ubiquinone oxidoreductase subunit NDUFA12-domain-containing protein [Mycotypha africana]|uniref:NADH ubiquinone oxidoreductase subunit NDUFA12-domain-containing protein n=1 Tax=Mycotypha africana TaxID=64632 RepID=UPI002300A73E|nr:NADH ubiquinone oxidoreductase subunit NDUFA12-domain-containing protein [Mycotypha africana]KAI8987283.1 NADH ubiquinone oxidoreductase subunit NDUFA12-domain-containing protein [Mycotypha africana]